ncbi:MAG: SDR family oxidoreductase [Deltaproteobacteria bacterium]|nr:SDR family oxidoreductase [Deltaproteobacteria bacterium]
METKVALITGANSGVGQAVTRSLATAGFNIAAQYYSNDAAAQAVEKDAQGSGVEVELLKCDLTKPGQAKDMADAVMEKFGRIDVLVNIIGPFYFGDILSFTPERWREAINMNLNINFDVTYYAREHICASKGHIINFSFAGSENVRPIGRVTAYGIAKTGVTILSKTLAQSLAPFGVRVNTISPGLFEVVHGTEEELSRQVPLGRIGKPEEIGETVKWLVTESPEYVTGANISVAGAWEG